MSRSARLRLWISLVAHMVKNMPKLHGMFCTCYPWLQLVVLKIMQYIMYFRFCFYVMFSYSGPNTGAWSLRRSEIFTVAPVDCVPGAKSAIADYLFSLKMIKYTSHHCHLLDMYMYTIRTSVQLITVNAMYTGIAISPYTAEFKKHRQLCLSILKRFGFGQRSMETRILMEVEEMIARIQAHQGRPFDVEHLVASCVANVIMNMVFGRRCDHSCPEFQQMISDSNDVITNIPFELEFLPILRSLSYYKKKVADNLAKLKGILDFRKDQITACLEVCNRRVVIVGLPYSGYLIADCYTCLSVCVCPFVCDVPVLHLTANDPESPNLTKNVVNIT